MLGPRARCYLQEFVFLGEEIEEVEDAALFEKVAAINRLTEGNGACPEECRKMARKGVW
jgi:hypothetical protein